MVVVVVVPERVEVVALLAVVESAVEVEGFWVFVVMLRRLAWADSRRVDFRRGVSGDGWSGRAFSLMTVLERRR